MGQAMLAGRSTPLYSETFQLSIPAASWVGTPPAYTLTHAKISGTNVVEMYHQSSATDDQIKMIQAANIVGGAQANGTLALRCLGDKPTAAVPLLFVIRSDT